MRFDFLQDVAFAAPGTGNVSLSQASGRKLPSYYDWMGGGGVWTRTNPTVEYELDALTAEGKIETGIGQLNLSGTHTTLIRTQPRFTWNNGTPALVQHGVPGALNFTTAPLVKCTPTSDNNADAFGSHSNRLGTSMASRAANTTMLQSAHVVGPLIPSSGATSASSATNQILLSPFKWAYREPLCGFAFYCNTASAGNALRVAVYDLNEKGFPRDLIVDLGTVALTLGTTWYASTLLTTPIHLPPGWYGLRMHFQSGAGMFYLPQDFLTANPFGTQGNGPVGCFSRTDITYAVAPQTCEVAGAGWAAVGAMYSTYLLGSSP